MSAARPSSRDSSAGAGWADCSGPGDWLADVPAGAKPNRGCALRRSGPRATTSSPSTSTTRSIAPGSSGFGWRVSAPQATGGDPDFMIRRGDGPFSFLLLGDPGEGDNSQYAVVPALLVGVRGHGLHGHLQRRDLPRGRAGRLPHQVLPPVPQPRVPDLRRARQPRLVRRAARLHVEPVRDRRRPGAAEGRPGRARVAGAKQLWRQTTRPSDEDIATMRADRARPSQFCDPAQPGPYWAIDAGPVRIVGIDTGIVGTLDADQAEWFRRVSLRDRPPQGPDHGQAADRQRRVDLGGAAQAHRRGRGRPGRQLHGGDRRRHPQLPALSGRPRRAHGPVRRQRRRRRLHARHASDPARRAGRRGRLPALPAAQRLAGEVLAALRREVRGREGPADALLGRGGTYLSSCCT